MVTSDGTGLRRQVAQNLPFYHWKSKRVWKRRAEERYPVPLSNYIAIVLVKHPFDRSSPLSFHGNTNNNNDGHNNKIVELRHEESSRITTPFPSTCVPPLSSPRNEVKRQDRNSPVECHGNRETRARRDRYPWGMGTMRATKKRKQNQQGGREKRRVTGNGVLVSIFIRTFGAFIVRSTEQPERTRERERGQTPMEHTTEKERERGRRKGRVRAGRLNRVYCIRISYSYSVNALNAPRT